MDTTLPAPALFLDERGLVRDVNDLALGLLRRPREALVGRTLGEVVEGSQPDGTPVRIKTLRSQQIDGTTLCLLRVVRGDELVEDLVSYFDAAFDHAPIGMAILGADGRYVRVNDALCGMLGRTRSQLIGERDNEITHPDDREHDVALAWRILRGELDCAQLEKRFVRPDGTVVWVISNMTYLRDDEGTGIAWVGQWQDVTAHRAVEVELRRERDLSAAMLAAMHEGFCLIDDDTVVQVNDAMCRLVGWTREEIIGTGWPFPWVPEDQVEQQALTRRRWHEAGRGEGDGFVLRRRDGRRFDASITSARATGPDGESLGYVVTVRDISERKRHEAELARQATHDPLTGLINHRGFHECLRGEIARCRRQGVPLSLAILDLDHFKQVNDTYGHPTGDRVLAELGRRFRTMTRAGEHIARVGGEEFALILPATDGAGAYAAAERARLAVAGEPFDPVGALTLSIGVCELGASGDADELHRLADVALYWAKDHGRNIAFRYTPDTAAHLEGRSDPRAAAAEHRLRLRAMHAIARMVEQGHPTSDGHAERVADLAAALAERLRWPRADIRALREAGVLHDIGKVVVPKSTLLKAGPFTPAEWAHMRQHPVVGEDMLEGVLSNLQRTWVRGHHERWAGGGYPDGLAAQAIPEGARILAVADSWDVMTSTRVYSGALALEDAVAEVRRQAGAQFDPAVAAVLLELVAEAPAEGAEGGERRQAERKLDA
ncbi:MAG: PAS domain S-box protein [Thermoleophilia bacterium]